MGCWQSLRRGLAIHLNPGVKYRNLLVFFFAVSFGTIALLVFANASLSFVLETYLDVPENERGTETGRIVFWNEVVVLLTIWAWGVLSDRLGRRFVYCSGTLLMMVAFIVTPFAWSFASLLGFRIIFAPGAAAASAMLVALLADYPSDDAHSKSRGKASGVMGLLAGLGALFSLFLLLRIPSWASSLPAVWQGRLMFWVAALFALGMAAAGLFGLAPKSKAAHYEHPSVFRVFVEGAKAAANPYIVLSYVASFAARGDTSVVSTFLPLWIADYGASHNLAKDAALARSGEVSGIVQVVALMAAPVIGVLCDKFNRLTIAAIFSSLGAVGYALLTFLDNPYEFGVQLVMSLLLVGLGEMSALIISQSLMGQYAPPEVRGAVSGFWGICGSAAILLSGRLGGYLYDAWIPGAPFLMFSIFNAAIAVLSVALLVREKCYGIAPLPVNGISIHEDPHTTKLVNADGSPNVQRAASGDPHEFAVTTQEAEGGEEGSRNAENDLE